MAQKRLTSWRHDAPTLVPLGKPPRRTPPHPRLIPRVVACSAEPDDLDDMETLVYPPFRFRDDRTIELDLSDVDLVADYEDLTAQTTLCD